MKQIKYTPDAAEKLHDLKGYLTRQYGKQKAKAVVKSITDSIRDLKNNERKGPEVSGLFDVDIDYRYLFVSGNYVFYRIEETCICIINIYNEKEDFMWKLFGIDTTSSETIEYWGE